MTAKELRDKYLEFFKSKEHAILPSSSLIPENDPTALFISAGMHPLVPYLTGEKHPEGRRLVSLQKCVRTIDIDEVGDSTHHTFFEMLGNWSLGDPASPDGIGQSGYFKKEAISWSWEFLTSPEWLSLDKNKIAVSVFVGDSDAPFDQEAYEIWQSLGINVERIAKLPKSDNWWGPAGQTGPCGPDTEMFYWTGSEKVPKVFNSEDKRWVEIWNDVFMEYNKKEDGSYEPLKQKNVDTGMGLERTLAVLNGLADNYQTELFKNIINKIEQLSDEKYKKSEENIRAMRIIADHLKAATFIMGDDRGVTPSNLDQGYVVRRLIRRAIRYGKRIGIKSDSNRKTWTKEIAKIVAHDYQETYPELRKNIDYVITELDEEEKRFSKTIDSGLEKINKIIKNKKNIDEKIYQEVMNLDTITKNNILKKIYNGEDTPGFKEININLTNKEVIGATISGKEAFNLYQTYGFPIEMIVDLVQEKNLFVDIEGFRKDFVEHQKLSRTASVGKFKGGLADASEETKKLHTAAHLLLAALRQVLGNQVVQKGSNITPERLRFDFSYNEKMTVEQIIKVEDLVNEAIKRDLVISCQEMPLNKAKEKGAMGVFESKYGEKVKVYQVGDNNNFFSQEICGGPHVERTGILGYFKIKKEHSSSAGVRRIKAVLG
ncbi:MAG: alanine--tRNA ligase-related protein [Patescibacteria group bacterium]